MKDKFNKIKNNVINEIKKIKENPKKEIITFINYCKEVVKNNVLFFVFVISLLFNTVLLRFFTIGTLENVLFYKPLFSDLTIILLFGSISFLIKKKHRFPFLLISSIFLTAICVINSCYYTFYTSFASVSLLSTTKYLVAVGDAVVENVLRIQDLTYIWAPIALVYTQYRLNKRKKLSKSQGDTRDTKKAFKVFIGACVPALVVALTLTTLEVGRLVKQWNREYIVMRFGIYVYHVNDLIKSVEPKLTSLFGYDEANRVFNEYYSDREDKQNWTNEYTGIFEGKNVIAIHLESMQNFLINLEFNGQEVTPNLNKLVNKSLYFSNFYAQVSVGTSSDSEFTYATSLMPTNNGTAFGSYFDREYVTLQKLLQEKDYYTFSMHANNAAFWNRNVMYKSIGYDKFYSKPDYEIDDVIGLGLSDSSFFRQSIEYIKEINEKEQPYYGLLIMLSNHTPFSDTDKYGEFDVSMHEFITDENGNEIEVTYPYLEGTKLGNYIKSAHYADKALGEFLTALEENNLMENTVLVLYGDHDARLGSSEFEKMYNYDKENDDILPDDTEGFFKVDTFQYDMIRKVPFIIYSEETEKKLHNEIDTVMGMYDVMPTLGNMLGVYNKYALGHDIFSTGSDNIVVFPNGNFATNKVFYNAQKGTYITLNSAEISDEYVQNNIKYADDLLNVSNSVIVFDLLKTQRELEESDEDYIEERVID